MRDELLNTTLFHSLNDARLLIAAWWHDYAYHRSIEAQLADAHQLSSALAAKRCGFSTHNLERFEVGQEGRTL